MFWSTLHWDLRSHCCLYLCHTCMNCLGEKYNDKNYGLCLGLMSWSTLFPPWLIDHWLYLCLYNYFILRSYNFSIEVSRQKPRIITSLYLYNKTLTAIRSIQECLTFKSAWIRVVSSKLLFFCCKASRNSGEGQKKVVHACSYDRQQVVNISWLLILNNQQSIAHVRWAVLCS